MTSDALRTNGRVIGSAACTAHPSLALIKYWGKADTAENIPATPSLAVTLDGLTTTTEVEITEIHTLPSRGISGEPPGDSVFIGSVPQPPDRFESFFNAFRRLVPSTRPSFLVTARSTSDYPTAAGLASSAAGFAALAKACADAAGLDADDGVLSETARIGSASAARSVFGGFVRLDAGARRAFPVKDSDWWPELRIVVVEVERGPKKVPTRDAMESVRATSPFYDSWLDDSKLLMNGALEALEAKDLAALGPLMRLSYMRMFGTMFSAVPPIIYWKPESLGLISLCAEMRDDGLNAWETMDAGPQVKILCLADDLEFLERRLEKQFPDLPRKVCGIGAGVRTAGSA